jgi:hypothetical protein
MQPAPRTAIAISLIFLACRLGSPAPAAPLPPTPTVFPTETEAALPTATALPVSTETPGPKILFSEAFDDETTCFRLHTFEPGVELAIENGAYHVRVEGDSGINLPCMGGYGDFALGFDFAFAETSADSLVGFTYRSYVGSAYTIYLSGLAEFCWDHADYNTEAFRVLAGCWLQLPEIVTSGDTLRMAVVAAQERMAVFIDGFLVAAISDSTNDYGSIGFFVLNNGAGATEFVIDNILIRELVESDLEVFREDQTGF